MGYRDETCALRERRRELESSLRDTQRELREVRRRLGRRAIASAMSWALPPGLLVLALAGLFLFDYLTSYHCFGPTSRTRSGALEIHTATMVYLGEHPGRPCPTLDDLVRADVEGRIREGLDGWGRPYEIACDGDEVHVVSAGPDGRFGSDDIAW